MKTRRRSRRVLATLLFIIAADFSFGQPVAVLTTNSPVDFQEQIALDGSRSRVDLPRTIVLYEWTLADGAGNTAFPRGSSATTTASQFQVPAPRGDPFPLGLHRFQLIVTDDRGTRSSADFETVLVRDSIPPTAVADLPATIPFGSDLLLDASRSIDTGGSIIEYEWTLLTAGRTEQMITDTPIEVPTPTFLTTMGPGAMLPVGQHQIRLRVTDDSGNVSPPVVSTVIVIDTLAPTAVADLPATIPFGSDLLLDASRSIDTGGSIIEYEWTLLTAGRTEQMITDTPIEVPTPTFLTTMGPGAMLPVGQHQIRLRVTDDSGNVSPPVVSTVIVIDTLAPTAVADLPATIPFGSDLLLDASRSIDTGGSIIEYEWTLLTAGRTEQMITDTPIEVPTPTFLTTMGPGAMLPVGQHQIRLRVTDDSGNVSPPVVSTVIVIDTLAPTAVADLPATIPFGSDLLLDASRSIDTGGSIIEYEWTLLTAGRTEQMITDTPIEVPTPTFLTTMGPGAMLPVGQHQIRLRVTDDSGNVSPPVVSTVIVIDTLAPTAVADLPPTIPFGSDLLLDASRSIDTGGSIIEYEWTLLTAGRTEQMITDTPIEVPTPTFLTTMGPGAMLPVGQHQIRLRVTDDSGNVSPPVVSTVIVIDTLAPTAVADLPATIPFGSDLLLDASRSIDTGGSIIEYEWTLLTAGRTEQMITDTPIEVPTPTFLTTMGPGAMLPVGQHQIRLRVTDDSGNVSPPVVSTVIVIDTLAPTAVADLPATIPFGSDLLLDASRSIDTGGSIIEYEWTLLTAGRTEQMITDTPIEVPTPTFLTTMGPGAMLPVGQHQIRLRVTDDSGNVSPPVVSTVIVIDTLAPTAVADLPPTIPFGSDLLLDASRSIDTGGSIIEYEWTLLTAGRTEQMITDTPIEVPTPTFLTTMGPGAMLPVGQHQIRLRVTDDSGNVSQPVVATITVLDPNAPPEIPAISYRKESRNLVATWDLVTGLASIEVWTSRDLDRWQLHATLPGNATTHAVPHGNLPELFVRLVLQPR